MTRWVSSGTDDRVAQRRIFDEVAQCVGDGLIRTTLNAVFGPLTVENLMRAHAPIESGRAIGTNVLRVE